MKNIIFLFVILFAFFACSNVNQPQDRLSQPQNRLLGFEKFQTFNEFKMKGVGEVKDTPFVYVKYDSLKISVIISNDIDSVIEYIKEGDYWRNIINIDFQNLGQEPCMCEDSPPIARTYLRYIKGDTILSLLFHPELIEDDIISGFGVDIITPREETNISHLSSRNCYYKRAEALKYALTEVNTEWEIDTIESWSTYKKDAYNDRYSNTYIKERNGDTLRYITYNRYRNTVDTLTYILNSLDEYMLIPDKYEHSVYDKYKKTNTK